MREVYLDESDLMNGSPSDLAGEKLNGKHYDRVFDDPDEDVTVYKPNGERLATVIRDAYNAKIGYKAYEALRDVAVSGGNSDGIRFEASGVEPRNRITGDGTVSDTMIVPRDISPNTGIVGNMDRYPRIPYCRQTSFNINNPEKFGKAVPMFQACDDVFAEHAAERYANQHAKANDTVDEWLISDTAFTTATVNLNWQTATHTDSGDLPEGFGVMTVIRLGDYDGAYYIQPEFRTAYDLYTGDVILSDVHEWHGNGPFHATDGYYERLSCVLYYRKEMEKCGTPEQERDRAKKLRDKGVVGDHEQTKEPNPRNMATKPDDLETGRDD